MNRSVIYVALGSVGSLIAILFLYTRSIEPPEPTRDKNGILLSENLHEKEDFKRVDGDNIFGFILRETVSDGSYMYLGEQRYTGAVIEYYEDKTIHYKGAYTEGEQSGTWLYYYPTGNITRQLKHDQPGHVSSAFEYYDNGSVRCEFRSSDNVADTAFFAQYTQHGRLEYLVRNTQSPQINYYEPADDQEMPSFSEIVLTYNPPSELIKANAAGDVYMYFHSDSIFYYKDPDSLNLLELRHLKDNKLQGESYLYYRNGRVMLKQEFDNNELNGEYVCYYANGKLRVKGRYLNWSKTGAWQEYFPSGKLNFLRTYSNNRLNGKYAEYNESGKLLEKGNYEDGTRTGNWLLKGNSETEEEEVMP